MTEVGVATTEKLNHPYPQCFALEPTLCKCTSNFSRNLVLDETF